MAYGYLIDPTRQFLDLNGKPIVGGWVEVFLHNTTTKYITFSDFSLTPNPFKIPIDIKGMTQTNVIAATINAYDVYIYDEIGTLFASALNVTIDNVSDSGTQFVLKRYDMIMKFSDGEYESVINAVTNGNAVCVQYGNSQIQLANIAGGALIFIQYSIEEIVKYSVSPTGGNHTITRTSLPISGGGSTEKREGFLNTNGNVSHEVSADELNQGYCSEDYVICSTTGNTNPFIAVFLQCTDFWSSNSFSSIDVYAVYEWNNNTEYSVGLFNIDSTAISNNSFKDFSVIGQVSLVANKNVKLRFKWNLGISASIGDNLLIKCNCFVASTNLYQSLQ